MVVLVVSVLGFTRTLQRAHQAAWRLSPQGVWGYAWGLLGAAALIAETVVFLLIGLLVEGAVLPTVLLRLALSVLMWWPVQWLLLGRRVGWRRLLPGAAFVGIGQVVVPPAALRSPPDRTGRGPGGPPTSPCSASSRSPSSAARPHRQRGRRVARGSRSRTASSGLS